MKLSCSAKKKHSPSDTSPEAGRGRPRGRLQGRPRGRSCGRPRGRCRSRQASRRASRHREANPPKPSKPSTPFKTSKPSKPSKHLLQQAPQGQGHFSFRPRRAKATAMAFYWLSKLPFASPQTLQTLQNLQTLQTPSKTLQTVQAWRHALSRWPKGCGS